MKMEIEVNAVVSKTLLNSRPFWSLNLKESQSYFVDEWRNFHPHGIKCFDKHRNAKMIQLLVKKY